MVAAVVANEENITRAGLLFKIGECVANSRAILEAHKQIEKEAGDKDEEGPRNGRKR